MKNIMSIDPGGTTGLYFKNGDQEQFLEINKTQNKALDCFNKQPWKETYREIKELVKELKINTVIYENTNYILKKTKEGLNLFRLLGALECLEVEEVSSVNVIKVKELTKQLLKGVKKIKNIEYLPGRGKGWMYKGKRVSIHCLEAYLVYYLNFL